MLPSVLDLTLGKQKSLPSVLDLTLGKCFFYFSLFTEGHVARCLPSAVIC